MTSLVNSATWAIGSGAGTFTLSFDAGSSANRVLHVFLADSAAVSTPTVTFNGVSLVQATQARGSGFPGIRNVLLYELIAPASGTNTLSVTYGTNSSTHEAFVASVDGVNQDCPWTVGLPSHAGSSAGGVITTPFSADSTQTCLSLAFSNSNASIAPVDGSLTVQANVSVGAANQLGVATKQGSGSTLDGRWTLPGGIGAAWYEIIYRPSGAPLSTGWYALTSNGFDESGTGNAFIGDQNIEPVIATTPQMTKITSGAASVMSAGMDASGNLYTWGSDQNTGMRGDGAQSAAGFNLFDSPTLVSGVSTVVDVAVGHRATFFAKANGQVWYFGLDLVDQTTAHTTAIQVPGLSNIVRVAAGDFNLLALDNAGKLWFVGDRNSFAQAGDGSASGIVTTPFNVLSNVADFALSELHVTACTTAGVVYCWGSNASQSTGQGTTVGNTLTPALVSGPSNVIQVAALDEPCTLALTSTNQVWFWGGNSFGERGNGTSGGNFAPVQVTMPAGPTYTALVPNYLSFECYVLTAAKTVFGWGLNAFGGIARNGFANVLSPQQMFPSLLTNVTAMANVGDDGWAVLIGPTVKGRSWVCLVGV